MKTTTQTIQHDAFKDAIKTHLQWLLAAIDANEIQMHTMQFDRDMGLGGVYASSDYAPQTTVLRYQKLPKASSGKAATRTKAKAARKDKK